jgi:hypothetical protein
MGANPSWLRGVPWGWWLSAPVGLGCQISRRLGCGSALAVPWRPCPPPPTLRAMPHLPSPPQVSAPLPGSRCCHTLTARYRAASAPLRVHPLAAGRWPLPSPRRNQPCGCRAQPARPAPPRRGPVQVPLCVSTGSMILFALASYLWQRAGRRKPALLGFVAPATHPGLTGGEHQAVAGQRSSLGTTLSSSLPRACHWQQTCRPACGGLMRRRLGMRACGDHMGGHAGAVMRAPCLAVHNMYGCVPARVVLLLLASPPAPGRACLLTVLLASSGIRCLACGVAVQITTLTTRGATSRTATSRWTLRPSAANTRPRRPPRQPRTADSCRKGCCLLLAWRGANKSGCSMASGDGAAGACSAAAWLPDGPLGRCTAGGPAALWPPPALLVCSAPVGRLLRQPGCGAGRRLRSTVLAILC